MNDPIKYPRMPIKATPYQHQRAAFEFACRMFGLTKGGDAHADTVQAMREADRAQAQPACQRQK